MVNPNIKDYGFGGKFRTREQDDEYRAKAKGVPKWTKEKCISRVNDILDRLDALLLISEKIETSPGKLKLENIRDLKIMMNTLLDYMKYLYPPVQKNVNVDIQLSADREEQLKEYFMQKYNICFIEKDEEKD